MAPPCVFVYKIPSWPRLVMICHYYYRIGADVFLANRTLGNVPLATIHPFCPARLIENVATSKKFDRQIVRSNSIRDKVFKADRTRSCLILSL
jgi:hypothetical protein